METKEKYTNSNGNVLSLLSGGFTGIDFTICFIIYKHSTIFLSIYQVDHKGKGKQKRKGKGRKGKRRTDINNENQHGPLLSPWKGHIGFH